MFKNKGDIIFDGTNRFYYILLFVVVLLFGGLQLNGQNDSSSALLDIIENFLNKQKLDEADSILNISQDKFLQKSNKSIQRYYYYLKGVSYYYHKDYENALALLKPSLGELYPMYQFKCDDYLKRAYYVADCLHKLNRKQKSEKIINDALIKCANCWESNPHSLEMYKLLIDINKQKPLYIIEKLHNEKQLISINIYDIITQTNKSKKLKEEFKSIQKRVNEVQKRVNDVLIKDTSYYYDIIAKARLLRQIEDFEESQFCFNQAYDYLIANRNLPAFELLESVLYDMILNYYDLQEYDNVVLSCEEYLDIFDDVDREKREILFFQKGIALYHMNKLNDALLLLEQVYLFLKTDFLAQTPMFVITAIYLDNCYYMNQNYEQSLKCALEAMNMYDEVGIDEFDILCHIYNDIGRAYLKLMDYSNSINYLKRSAELQLKHNGFVDENTNEYIYECNKHI